MDDYNRILDAMQRKLEVEDHSQDLEEEPMKEKKKPKRSQKQIFYMPSIHNGKSKTPKKDNVGKSYS